MAFKIAQSFANFFASECDRNNHQFKSDEEMNKWFVHKQSLGRAPFVDLPVNCYGIEYNPPQII